MPYWFKQKDEQIFEKEMRGKIFILVKDKDVATGMLQHLYFSLTRFLSWIFGSNHTTIL